MTSCSAFNELYPYYRSTEGMLTNLFRDEQTSMPTVAQLFAGFQYIAAAHEVLMTGRNSRNGPPSPRRDRPCPRLHNMEITGQRARPRRRVRRRPHVPFHRRVHDPRVHKQTGQDATTGKPRTADPRRPTPTCRHHGEHQPADDPLNSFTRTTEASPCRPIRVHDYANDGIWDGGLWMPGVAMRSTPRYCEHRGWRSAPHPFGHRQDAGHNRHLLSRGES